MALVGLPGSKRIFVGPNPLIANIPGTSSIAMDATNEAVIMIGNIETSDGGSHTIDTTGSSSIFWQTDTTVTFANGGTTVKVGLAAVDTATGPAGRAVNAANVIIFDVSKTLTGGGGGITANAAQNHVPDAGSKTINNGDLIALCIQMTARGGVDIITVNFASINAGLNRPLITQYLSAAYTALQLLPNAFITFSDGATGWFFGSEVFSTVLSRAWHSGSATKEYGQLYSLPFPTKIYGLHAWVLGGNNFDLVLYSDPLGSPAAEQTISIDANTIASSGSPRPVMVMFPSPYTTTADQPIAAVFKPTVASNITAYYKTLASAAQRVSDPWGTSGYGISRASGAFADANSGLDHYYIGLIAGAFNEEASAAIVGGSVIS